MTGSHHHEGGQHAVRSTCHPARSLGLLLVLFLAASTHPPHGFAADGIPPDRKVTILLTALSFNTNLRQRAGDQLTILGVGECEAFDTLRTTEGRAVNGIPIRIREGGTFTSAGNLESQIEEYDASVLFICSASTEEWTAMGEVATRNKMILIADDPQWVETSATLGVGLRDNRPQLVLNMKNATAAGAEFDARIFGVARVIR